MALHLLATLNLNSVNNCLACLGPSDTLLLLGDGIYQLSAESSMQSISAITRNVYALEEDVKSCRPDLLSKVPIINYDQWVELTTKITPVVSWY